VNLSGNAPGGIEAGYTGATNGTSANSAVNGTVVVNNHADIAAAAGHGINAYNYGNGDLTVNSFAGTSISVAGPQSIGINAAALSGGTGDVTIALGENVTISGATSYGIRAYSIDQGDISVTLAKGDNITSGSSGIVAVNYATAIATGLDSTITVEAHGSIHSGTTPNGDGSTPGAIIAGYKPGGNGSFSNAVNGDVIVDSDAHITADAGYGIEAFTWGAGDITVTAGQNSQINAAGIAIAAFDHGGGDVSVTNEGSATGSVGLSVIANGGGDVTIGNDGDITGTSRAGISVTQNEAGATGSTHITNTGAIAGATGFAAIFIQGNVAGDVVIDNSGTIGPDDAASTIATTYAIVATGGAVTINNSGDINGNVSDATATFNNNQYGTWTVSGTSVFGNLSSIVNAGDIDLLNGASVSGTGLGITNSHQIDSWGTTSITGAITNTGTIEVNDGTLTLFGSLSGSGSVTLDANATLKLEGTVSQTITFAGDGAELKIDTSDFGGSIAGFAATDKIDLSSITYDIGTTATYDPHSGNLVVSDAYGHSITLNLVGDYTNAHFAGSDDGTGHTRITLNADDDALAVPAGEAAQAASFSELADTTGASTSDPTPAATGTIHFTDVDLTDRPTADITTQVVTGIDSDGTTALTLTADQAAALKQALQLSQAGNTNNGSVGWSYSIADQALDFLGKDQTAKVVSTITLDDHQGSTTTAEVTVTITGTNDAPMITVKGSDSAGAELNETNDGQTAHGTLTLSDADATDHVTVAVDHLDIVLDGVLQTDQVSEPLRETLLSYLTPQQGDVLDGTATHAQFTWNFNSGNEAFDFLAAGHTLSLQYTIAGNDGFTTGAGSVITINIAGSNDAPTLDGATLDTVAANDADPAGTAVGALFAGKFHDPDDGASLKAVAVTADNASADQGVWQYEVAGSDQWVDITNVGEASALVLSSDTLIRFMPAAGFSGAPGTLDVHALDDTYTGDVTTTATPVSIDVSGAGHGGITPVSDQAASIGTEVLAPTGPVLTLDGLDVDGNAVENSAVTVTINDPDAPTGSGIVYSFEVYDVNTSSWTSVQASGGNSYTPSESDEGQQLRVEVSYTDLHGRPEDLTASAGTVQDDPNETAHVELAGLDDNNNAVDGTPVVATVTDNDAPGSGITYIFQTYDVQTSSWSIVQQGSGNSYTPSESDDGKSLKVDVSFTDTYGNFETGEAWAGTVQPHPPFNTNVWTGEAGGQEWNTGGNWSLGHVPTATEAVVVDTDGAVDLALDDDGYTIGPLSLGATTALDVNGTGWDSQTEQVNSYLLVDGELSNSGVIDVQNASLDVFHHVANAGTIEADGDNATVNFGNLSGDTIDNAGGYVQANDGGRVNFLYNTINGGEIDAYGEDSVVLMHQSIVNGVTLNGADGGHFKVAGTTTFNSVNGPMSIGADIHIEVGGMLVLDGAVNDAGEVLNQGTLVVETGAAQLLGDLAGPGSVQIIDAASLELGGISESAIGFVGNGTGTLRLDAASHFTGTVTGFSYGDAIDIAGVAPGVVGLVSAGGELQVHYGPGDGAYFTITGNYDEAGFAKTDDGNGGTELVWTHQSPVIDTTHFVHTHNPDNTDTLTDLSVAGSSKETYSFTAVTEQASAGSSVTPDSGDDLSLTQLNADLAGGVTYDQGSGSFTNDKITLTVTDGFGASDAVNFIFNQGGQGPVVLNGTSGKDVIFGAEHSDTLISGGGQDQFVFTPVDSSPDAVLHTIYGFDTTLDKIDLRQFDGISSFGDLTITQESADTLVTLDSHESVLLKNVLAGNLHANGFIITSHGA
jgi:VCBS repeat-containing protein